jgi:hypothetical protein
MTLMALGTLLQACGKGDGTGPNAVPATPQGEYTLNMIEQKPLPYAWFSETNYTLEVTGGTISIKSDGKWVSKITSRETVAGFVSTYIDSTFGTWTSANGSASLTNAESSTISSATWTAADVTVTDVDGTTTRKILYRKN